LGVARVAFDEIVKLPPAARAKAAAVGSAFESLASQISAGTLGGFKIGSETRKEFDAATGDQKEAWKVVDLAIQAKLRALGKEKKIKDTADLADAYREIAAGCGCAK
jgi:hypothetical protein